MTDNKFVTEAEISLYLEAWEKWGPQPQLTMINEECAELIQAVCKNLRNDNPTTENHIVEEMADVAIMIEQYLVVKNLDEYYYKIRQMKLERLKEKLKDV